MNGGARGPCCLIREGRGAWERGPGKSSRKKETTQGIENQQKKNPPLPFSQDQADKRSGVKRKHESKQRKGQGKEGGGTL